MLDSNCPKRHVGFGIDLGFQAGAQHYAQPFAAPRYPLYENKPWRGRPVFFLRVAWFYSAMVNVCTKEAVRDRTNLNFPFGTGTN